MAFPLSRGRTALITGATSGIGKEFCLQLARRGCDLVMVARDLNSLQELASVLRERHHIRAIPIAADLANVRSPHTIYQEVIDSGIKVDVLVNNAGFNVYGSFLETDLQSEIDMIAVNLTSLVGLSKLFGGDMAKRGEGKILNVGSTASFAPSPFASIYGATKAAVLSLSEALAEEFRGSGVTVTVLCPGPTATEFARRAKMTGTKIFSGSLESAAAVAQTGLASLESGKPLSITRFANSLQIFSMRFSPRRLVAKVGRSLLSPTA